MDARRRARHAGDMEPPTIRAIVVGAGIGGLAAAIALRQAGAEVTVLERADSLEPLGAGLSLWPNAVLALRDLGVAEAIESADIPRGEAGLYSWDGSPLATSGAADIDARFGAPLVLLHRSEIQEALAGALPEGAIVTGAALEHVEQDAAGVRATFSDGRSATADLLVGADGLHSTVRAALLGEEPPRPSGLVAYRAVVSGATAGLTGECWGDRRVFGVVPLSGGRTYWYATAPDGEAPSEPSEASRMLGERFAGWADPIPATFSTPTPGLDGLESDSVTSHFATNWPFSPIRPGLGPGIGRTQFVRELARRVEVAKAHRAAFRTIAVIHTELTANLDLLVKHRISVVRSPFNTGFQPQSVRNGVAASSGCRSHCRRTCACNLVERNGRSIERRHEPRDSGLVHLVVELATLKDQAELASLERILTTVQRRRNKGLIAVVTMQGLVARLAPQRQAASGRSVLRVA